MSEDHPELSIKRRTMNGKPVFEIEVKTIVNFQTAFIHKLLCTIATFSLATACVYACAFCYVGASVRKHPAVRRLAKIMERRGLKFHDVVMLRSAALDILREQLTIRKPVHLDLRKPGVIFSSNLVDPAGNMELVRQTVEACLIILELTAWDIRLLSKSNLLPEVAKRIPDRFRHRMIFGVSTGTLEDQFAAAIESGTPLVSKRIASLHWLQDQGYRTFGMICPSLPQDDYGSFAREMAAIVRIDRCEHVWAEVLNVRGSSMARTLAGLQAANLAHEADKVQSVCGPGNKAAWEEYARQTFLAHTACTPPDKLRFLQYVTKTSRPWWAAQQHRGAILLGKASQA